MTIQDHYRDSFRQTQETWAGVVEYFTKDPQRTFGQPFNPFAVVDPIETIDQIFDFWGRSLKVQRDVVKQLVSTTLAATEKVRDQAEQVSGIMKDQAERVADLTVKQAEHDKEQAEKVEQAVREQAEKVEQAVREQAEEAEKVEKAAACKAKRVEREEARKVQQHAEAVEEAEKAAAREAKRVEREEAKKAQQQAREAYNGLTKAELSDQLAGRGLPKTGNVEDLIERLVSSDSE